MKEKRINPRLLTLLLAGALVGLLASPLLAAEGELGVQAGILGSDNTLAGNDERAAFANSDPAFGLRGALRTSEHWSWFLDVNYAEVETRLPGGDIDALAGRTGFERLFGEEGDRVRAFLNLGLGYLDLEQTNIDAQRVFGSLGGGVAIPSGERNNWRLELRLDRVVGDEGFSGRDFTQLYALVGYSFGVGTPPVDSDGDGVFDRRDRCPDTPAGAIVDERGCPQDSDGDGVYDGIDECPATPEGYPVDAKGCPKDSDGDGVVDGADECPDTPAGAHVDERGCPKDGDGDGVFDGIDRCPNTPEGARVDERGCPQDSDGDGVFDGIDACPGTPRGATVDERGCPSDGDEDGVYDGIDACPDTAPGAEIDARGCEIVRFIPQESGQALVLEGVNFELNSAQLTGEAREVLDEVAQSLLKRPEVRIVIEGHTDSSGSAAYNKRLSLERARSVLTYLQGQGVGAGRMSAEGVGEEQPVASNESEAGRAANRRVELRRVD